MYTIPEELSPGIIVAHITAEDPDDRGFTSFLLYSITTVNSYFMINQCKSNTYILVHSLIQPFGLFYKYFLFWSEACLYMYQIDQISRSVMSDSLQPYESQHARPPCPSPTPYRLLQIIGVIGMFLWLHLMACWILVP